LPIHRAVPVVGSADPLKRLEQVSTPWVRAWSFPLAGTAWGGAGRP
jgi:hypothetical protein